jgi:hypothetical protein
MYRLPSYVDRVGFGSRWPANEPDSTLLVPHGYSDLDVTPLNRPRWSRKHSEAQIIAALKQVEAGRAVEDLAREYGVSKHTIYAWKSKYGGMEARRRRSSSSATRIRD